MHGPSNFSFGCSTTLIPYPRNQKTMEALQLWLRERHRPLRRSRSSHLPNHSSNLGHLRHLKHRSHLRQRFSKPPSCCGVALVVLALASAGCSLFAVRVAISIEPHREACEQELVTAGFTSDRSHMLLNRARLLRWCLMKSRVTPHCVVTGCSSCWKKGRWAGVPLPKASRAAQEVPVGDVGDLALCYSQVLLGALSMYREDDAGVHDPRGVTLPGELDRGRPQSSWLEKRVAGSTQNGSHPTGQRGRAPRPGKTPAAPPIVTYIVVTSAATFKSRAAAVERTWARAVRPPHAFVFAADRGVGPTNMSVWVSSRWWEGPHASRRFVDALLDVRVLRHSWVFLCDDDAFVNHHAVLQLVGAHDPSMPTVHG